MCRGLAKVGFLKNPFINSDLKCSAQAEREDRRTFALWTFFATIEVNFRQNVPDLMHRSSIFERFLFFDASYTKQSGGVTAG